jgi:hypothetical protein
MKAWLITWEWSGNHAKREDKIVAVLNSRLAISRVAELVEFLYLTECYTLSEKMAVAHRKRQNPYPAQHERGAKSGPLIVCGHNPHLVARWVDELRVERDDNGRDIAVKWTTRDGIHHTLALR